MNTAEQRQAPKIARCLTVSCTGKHTSEPTAVYTPRVSKELVEKLDTLLATWFGCGNSPIAPGTVGSFGAIPVHALLRLAPLWVHVLATLGITAAGFWRSERYANRVGTSDPQSVVIDEVAGALIAMGMVRSRSIGAQVLALALFRLFDITKPGPIDAVQDSRPVAVGIMSDDLLAGFLAGTIARWLSPR